MAMQEHDEIAAAAAQFYSALNALFIGDMGPMTEIWSHADDVTYMGPDGGFQVGWQDVRADWEKQAALKLGGRVDPEGMIISQGSELGITHNYEKGANANTDQESGTVSIRATNLFRKEKGVWKMIGHHTDTLPFLNR
ncbi:MAG: nuclear transport factor 2 family protein [Pseudomonadota bacterium]